MKGSKVSATFIAAVACLALVAGGCTSSKDSGTEKGVAEKKSSSDCTPRDGETTPKALLRCADRSIVFIENEYGTGTGVVVSYDDVTYVVTNLHVVDPFASADVSINATDELGRLPVVGADVPADIALLGPVPNGADVTPLPLGDPKVAKGDDVFLVGFPGSSDVADADLTITSGLASRTRKAAAWKQTYVQSDAVIAGGQSGGALFAESGELAGISGLSYQDAFSLSLSIQDVERSIKRITAGEGDEIIQVPLSADDHDDLSPSEGATEGTLEVPDDIESPTMFLPPSEEDREWSFTMTGPEGRFSVTAVDGLTGEPLLANAAGVELTKEIIESQAERLGVEPTALIGGPIPTVSPKVAARETVPGIFSLTVPADVAVEIVAAVAPDAAPTELRWTSDLPLWPLTEEIDSRILELDTPVMGTMSGYRLGVPFQVQLEAGQKVELSAGSPQGDVALVITGPGRALTSFDLNEVVPDEEVKIFDDSDEGLYGLDVAETFTATEAGLYNLAVQNNDMSPMAYRVEVSTT